jgi:hypothetical protein
MAFAQLNFNPAGGQSKSGAAPQLFTYRTTDSVATCDTSGYFNAVTSLLNVGDIIDVQVVDSVTTPAAVSGNGRLIVQSNSAGVVDTYNSLARDKIYLTVTMADISAASSVWVVAPVACTFTKAWGVLNAAITGADAVLTSEIGGTLVTSGGVTVANSGSAAGTVFTITPTAANTLTAGQALEIITDGASSTTSIVTFTVEFTPTTPTDSD